MSTSLRRLQEIDVRQLNGVGDKKRESLQILEIENVLDLLTHYPRRYIDRTQQSSIRDLKLDEESMVLATVKRVQSRRTRNGKSLVEVDVFDGSSYLSLSFFNQPWRAKQLAAGTEAVFFGKVTAYRGKRQMANPVVDLIGNKTGKIIPVYPQSEKAQLTTWELGEYVAEALRRGGDLADPLPEAMRDRLDLVDRTWAMHAIHAPESMAAAQAARKRLAFDELLRLQCVLVARKRRYEAEAKGVQHVVDSELVRQFVKSLPFPLTGAQQRVIDKINRFLASPHPMHLLLQGDVGSGKTVVAVTALLTAVAGGYQGALMAPTEVLAEQHALGVRALLRDLEVPSEEGTLFSSRPLRVELLTGRSTAKERREIVAGLESGAVDIVIGTHALITEGVAFRELGVAVIDEQHRFGVEQRAALRGKGSDPDVLVMTATPIPRTAAMTVYGDLDVAVLDELPPGRTPIVTTWARGELEETAAWKAVRDEVAAGRQAYVVCPLIEGSEKIQAASAIETYDELAAGELHGLRLALLHGQVPAKEREATMASFRAGDIDVLVATTVIEVGVDVPNATVMVIVNADRFGLAQLHQLRGRVGRGAAASRCYLLGETTTPDGEERLAAMVRTTDGFELAEVDLEIRGEGTVLGTRQKGRNDLKLASLRRDVKLVEAAREVAFELVDPVRGLQDHPILEDEVRLLIDDEEAEFLFKS
ncbi:MAG TPA: ATP-dependent DNA helicase RecG [Acidimicrobiales bacterium]|nr:ATP-dependent DNA helicase RecG [Acidimicrobiales bacterium]